MEMLWESGEGLVKSGKTIQTGQGQLALAGDVFDEVVIKKVMLYRLGQL